MKKTRHIANNIKESQHGFTVIELAVVMLVSTILVINTAPAFVNYFERNNLKGAAETLYSHIAQARSESIKRFTPIYVKFNAPGTKHWSFGLSDTPNCDTQQALGSPADCTLQTTGVDVLHIVSNTASNSPYGNIALSGFSDLAMSSSNSNLEIPFEPTRGTASPAALRLSSPSGWIINILITPLGVDFCSPAGSAYVGGYQQC